MRSVSLNSLVFLACLLALSRIPHRSLELAFTNTRITAAIAVCWLSAGSAVAAHWLLYVAPGDFQGCCRTCSVRSAWKKCHLPFCCSATDCSGQELFILASRSARALPLVSSPLSRNRFHTDNGLRFASSPGSGQGRRSAFPFDANWSSLPVSPAASHSWDGCRVAQRNRLGLASCGLLYGLMIIGCERGTPKHRCVNKKACWASCNCLAAVDRAGSSMAADFARASASWLARQSTVETFFRSDRRLCLHWSTEVCAGIQVSELRKGAI